MAAITSAVVAGVGAATTIAMQAAKAAGAFDPEQEAQKMQGGGEVQLAGQSHNTFGQQAAQQPMQQPNLQQPLQQPNPLGGLPGGGGWM